MANENKHYEIVQAALKHNEYLSTPQNNKLLLVFLKSKFDGGYCRLIYDKKINDIKTALKKAVNIRKIDQYFRKNFTELTEKEMLLFRDALNNDKIKANKTLIVWQNGKSHFEVMPTTRPISHRTKIDLKTNLEEFYQFVAEYSIQELKKELPDIMRYFKLQKPADFKEINVKYIPDEELATFLNNIRNRHFKALVQLSLMSCARPCESINVIYGQGKNLYKNKQGKWIIHLPKIKGVSYTKFPFEIDLYEDELIPYFESLKLKEGDKVFHTTQQTFARLMKHYSGHYLSKTYSPKILRKTGRMLRSNAGYSNDWINKLCGHAPGSKIVGHYINYEGIKNDNAANDRLKGQLYPSLKQDYENLRLQTKAQEERIKELDKKADEIAKLRATVEVFQNFMLEKIGSKTEAEALLNKIEHRQNK